MRERGGRGGLTLANDPAERVAADVPDFVFCEFDCECGIGSRELHSDEGECCGPTGRRGGGAPVDSWAKSLRHPHTHRHDVVKASTSFSSVNGLCVHLRSSSPKFELGKSGIRTPSVTMYWSSSPVVMYEGRDDEDEMMASASCAAQREGARSRREHTARARARAVRDARRGHSLVRCAGPCSCARHARGRPGGCQNSTRWRCARRSGSVAEGPPRLWTATAFRL